MMKKLFCSAHFKVTLLSFFFILFFAGCEQEEASLIPSAEVDVQPLGMQTNSSSFIGRIAISVDGNYSDRDDIGATPMGLAILAHAGLQNKLVHYDYNSWIWGNGPNGQKEDMTESTLGAASRFGFDKSVFISAIDAPSKAMNSIADAINKSSSSNPLYIIVGGPMAVVCEGIKRADADKRKYVTVISHSEVNNNYTYNGSCTADGVKATGVNFVQIKDQNEGLDTGSWSPWLWLQTHSNDDLQWVYERMNVALDWADVSDAGMVWYLLKNDENTTSSKLQSYFADSSPTTDPDDDEDKNCQASGSTIEQAISNFENACGINYDKSKGHDCDPDGNGGWICSTGDVEGDGGSSGGGDNPADNDPDDDGDNSNNENCEAYGSTLEQAQSNFENACGINYDKSKGHDCDPDGNGGWICSTAHVGGSSGGDEAPGTSDPKDNDGNCEAYGSTLEQAQSNFENACGINYDKSKGHDCDPDGNGGWVCSSNNL